MAGRTVDIVATGPPPLDPYEPASSAWALAGALAAAGDDVRVLHLPGSDADRVPEGVLAVPVEIPLRRPGGPEEPAEFAAAAGRRVRRPVDLVLRDPVGLGPLGTPRGRRRGPVVGAFARGSELAAFEGGRRGHSAAGVVERLDTWRDRRTVRRLERTALEEADRLFYDVPAVAELLSEEYGVPARKLVRLPSAVPLLPPFPARNAARQDLRIPTDVPVVVAPTAFATPEPSGVDRILEAFRRVRPFFPGVRLVLHGGPVASDPGVVAVADRRAASLAASLATADVAVFARRAPGFDFGIVFAARAAIPPIVTSDANRALYPADGVHTAATDDPGDLASALAEMLADPALGRDIGKAAARFAEPYAPDRVASALTEALTPRAA